MQAWCEVGRASTPASDTVGELEGDDWLGSSSQVGPSEGTEPIPPSHPSYPFHQNLRSVQELSEEAISASSKRQLQCRLPFSHRVKVLIVSWDEQFPCHVCD